jgi:hypothetical protein
MERYVACPFNGGASHSALEPCRAIGFAEADRTHVDADDR